MLTPDSYSCCLAACLFCNPFQHGPSCIYLDSLSTEQFSSARPDTFLHAAADLHTIGGLPTLLSLLQDSHASIRWRAAEVVATCVQNNPPVQQVSPSPLQRLDLDSQCPSFGLAICSIHICEHRLAHAHECIDVHSYWLLHSSSHAQFTLSFTSNMHLPPWVGYIHP